MTRRYDEADRVLDRALAIAPEYVDASMTKAWLHEAWKGETNLAQAVLREARGRLQPRGPWGVQDFWIFELLEHNPREALPLLDSLQSDSIIGGAAVIPKAFFYAVAYDALGDPARARKEYEVARSVLEASVDKHTGRTLAIALVTERTLLARCYAGLGRKDDALREARRAVEILPISKDTLLGPGVEIDRAAVEARVGETDAAIEHIRQLLSISCRLSPALLRIDPKWAPLRGDPRFRQLAGLGRE